MAPRESHAVLPQNDLAAAAECGGNHSFYRELVALEALSTFSFRADRWLGDVAPSLLGRDFRGRFEVAKRRAKQREAAEARIPAQLRYESGWPRRLPLWSEARLLSEIRLEIAAAVGIVIGFTQPDTLMTRYEESCRARWQKKGSLKHRVLSRLHALHQHDNHHPVVWNRVESTAILLPWIFEPETRLCPVNEVLVICAQNG